MESQKPRKRKKRTLLWIVLIAVVLLAGAFGLYTQLDLNRPAPVAIPVVARVKIPPMPPSPATMSTGQPSSQSENVQSANIPPALEAGRGSAATGSSPNISPSEPVQAAAADRQRIIDRVEPENAPPPPAVPTAGSGQSAMQASADAQEDQTVAPLASDYRPAADSAAPQPSPAQQMEPEPAPSASHEKAKPRDNPEPPAPFSIQVGAYLTKAYADQMAAQLMEKGYDAYIFQRTDKKQRVWHLVRFGHFQNREAAAQAMQAFKDQEQMDASVALSNAI